MTMVAVLPLPGLSAPREGRVLWFSSDGCVQWSEDGISAEVLVGGTLIGRFGRRESGARNVLALDLAEDSRVHLGHLARAFRMTAEALRLIRRQRDEEGLAAVVGRVRGGSEKKLQGEDLELAERLFRRGGSLKEVQAALARRKVAASVGMLSGVRAAWRGREMARTASDSQASTAVPASGETGDTGEAAEATVEALEEGKAGSETMGDLPVRSGRFVQSVGTWLLLGMVNALGLYRAMESERMRPERKGRRLRTGTVRVALDALIAALAVGQKCAEGVRRLQTATAGVLLRAARAPSASWVRRVLGLVAGKGLLATANGLHWESRRGA